MATDAEIYQEARSAAQVAATAENDSLPPEKERGFDVGFAWVTIEPARGPFVSFLKKQQIGGTGSYGGGRGYGLWYGDIHTVPTQSISVHEAATREFVRVLKDHGINASWSSRLD